MPTADDIRRTIEQGLPDARVQVFGDDGAHFEAVIVSPAFDGLSLVARHQQVYRALGDRMKSEIHALSFKTLTPAEAGS